MAFPTTTLSVCSTRSAFLHNELLSANLRCTTTSKRVLSDERSLLYAICSGSSKEVGQKAASLRQGNGRRAAVMAGAAGAALLVMKIAGVDEERAAQAAMQKVEGTRRDTQDAVTRGLREPSQLSSGKGNAMREAARLNTQASGGTILGAPRFEEPGGAYRSPQSQTEKSFDKRSTPAGVLQQRALAPATAD